MIVSVCVCRLCCENHEKGKAEGKFSGTIEGFGTLHCSHQLIFGDFCHLKTKVVPHKHHQKSQERKSTNPWKCYCKIFSPCVSFLFPKCICENEKHSWGEENVERKSGLPWTRRDAAIGVKIRKCAATEWGRGGKRGAMCWLKRLWGFSSLDIAFRN